MKYSKTNNKLIAFLFTIKGNNVHKMEIIFGSVMSHNKRQHVPRYLQAINRAMSVNNTASEGNGNAEVYTSCPICYDNLVLENSSLLNCNKKS